MIRLLTDENFDQRIIRGLLARLARLDCVSVQSIGMAGSTDDQILDYAAKVGRVVVTHDVQTVPAHAVYRLRANLLSCGVIVVPNSLGIGKTIDDLEVLIRCTNEADLLNVIYFLPI